MYIAERTDTPCQEYDAKMWFAKQNTMSAQKAKALCYDCPERRQCLDSVVSFEQKHGATEHGIYGGLDNHERGVFLQLTPVAVSA
jgi:hypothetical protein